MRLVGQGLELLPLFDVPTYVGFARALMPFSMSHIFG